jgi:U3 small nucleolar RNA-associated protein 10
MTTKNPQKLSTLQKQLRTISQQNKIQGGPIGSKQTVRHPSILFTEFEAADLDLSDIKTIGMKGFEELQKTDHYWDLVESHIFPEDALLVENYDRSLKTKEENDKIDEILVVILRRLSLNYDQVCAHQLMEWLIRAFRVNEMNIEAVMCCILPWHETPAFVRTVQTLFFKDDDKWGFLFEKVKRDALTVTREFLAKRAMIDFTIIQSAFDTVQWLYKMGFNAELYCSFFLALCLNFVSLIQPRPKHFLAMYPVTELCARSITIEPLQIAGYLTFIALMQKYRDDLENYSDIVHNFMSVAQPSSSEWEQNLTKFKSMLLQ